ncbi:hypothetical protein CEXT_208021 [Caerostris extrusa]|uniref:Uncharacterized protein n=1 Tax=Caerostris extrusa TaxID=172846 RepID=A0AAV4MR97_CAEEX|nr:hypothetical protein CEXT_208021 [Caerostris extrusa]
MKVKTGGGNQTPRKTKEERGVLAKSGHAIMMGSISVVSSKVALLGRGKSTQYFMDDAYPRIDFQADATRPVLLGFFSKKSLLGFEK